MDLAGRTLLPGFIDAHGHVFNVGVQAVAANLLAPPDGQVTDIASLQATLRAWGEKSPGIVARTGWIVGMGYDDSQLGGQRHPTRDELDAVSTVTPVLVVHQSGHLAVLNSKGLEASGIRPRPSNRQVEQSAGGPAAVSRTASSAARPGSRNCSAGSAGSAARTTRRSCWPASIATPSSASPPPRKDAPPRERSPPRPLWPSRASSRCKRGHGLQWPGPFLSKSYAGRFPHNGAKLTLSGSPQGKTAWLTEPYRVRRGSGQGLRGLSSDDRRANETLGSDQAFKNGWQSTSTAMAMRRQDQFIRAVRLATAKYRPVPAIGGRS